MQIKLYSFGVKHRKADAGDAYVDVRRVRNPHHVLELKPLDGRHPKVQDYVMPEAEHLASTVILKAQAHGRVGVCCFGGRHRSVAVVEIAARRLREAGREVTVEHRELRD
jgi:UPF0042 nucleotide-binding protein